MNYTPTLTLEERFEMLRDRASRLRFERKLPFLMTKGLVRRLREARAEQAELNVEPVALLAA